MSDTFFDQVATLLNQQPVRVLYSVARRLGVTGDYARRLNPKSAAVEVVARRYCDLHAGQTETLVAVIEEARTALKIEDAPQQAPVSDAVSVALGVLRDALTQQPQGAGLSEEQVVALVEDLLDRRNARVLRVEVADHVTEVEGSKHAQFETLLRAINTRIAGRRLHVWMTGPSGSGKSYLAEQVATASGLAFYQTGAVGSKYDLVGFVSPSGDAQSLRTPFRIAFEEGGLFAWDEIDSSDPRALCAFNDALANGRYSFPDRMVTAHPDFVAVASANTWGGGATQEYVGRTRIDAATINRFVRIAVDYDEALELTLAGERRDWALFVQSVRRAVAAAGLKILITPRHTMQGAALLTAGLSREEVERMTVFAGLDQATVDRIRLAA